MHGFGGYRIGRTFLVDRLHLLGELRRIEQTAEFRSEWQRKERLSDQLDQIRRCRKAARVVVLVNPEVRERRIAGLSNGIHLGPSELRIVFEDAEDLVRKLVELSQAAANDFETFQSVAEGYAG
jgi:hypothetical protein